MDFKDAWWQGDGQANGNTGKPYFCHRGREFPNLSQQRLAPRRKARSQVRGARQCCMGMHKGMAGQPRDSGEQQSSTQRMA